MCAVSGSESESNVHRKRSWRRRWLVLALLLVGAAVPIVLLTTQWGAQRVVRSLVAGYAARVPGHIEIAAVEGRLWSGWQLRGVQAQNAEGRGLAQVERLGLDWSFGEGPWDLELAVELSGVALTPALVEGGWSDLVPPSPAEPPPPSSQALSVPLGLRLTLDVDGVAIPWPGRAEHRLDLERLELRAQAHESDFLVELNARAQTNALGGVELTRFDLRGRYDAGLWQLEALELVSNRAQVEIAGLSVHPQRALADLEAASVHIDGPWLAERIEGVAVSGDVTAAFRREMPGRGQVEFDWPGLMSGDARLDFRTLPSLKLGVQGGARVTWSAGVEPKQTRWSGQALATAAGWRTEFSVECDACLPGRRDLAWTGSASWQRELLGSLQLHSEARGPGLALDLDLSPGDEGALQLKSKLEVDALERYTGFKGAPGWARKLRGRVGLELDCRADIAETSGRCRTRVQHSGGAPIESLDLGASVAFGPEGVVVELEQLALESASAHLRSSSEQPARVEVDSAGRVEWRDVQLSLEDRGKLARIESAGRFASDGDTHVEFAVEEFDLEVISRHWPTLDIGGRVAIDVRGRGRGTRPSQLDARWRVAELEWQGVEIGTNSAELTWAKGRARVELQSENGLLGRTELKSSLPIDPTRAGSFVPTGPINLRWTTHGARLGDLSRLLAVEPKFSGRADLELVAEGDWRSPKIDLEWDVSELHVLGHAFGDLRGELDWAGALLALDVSLAGAELGSARISGKLPLQLSLDRARVVFPGQRGLELDVELDSVNLAAWGGIAGHPGPIGTLDSQLALGGSWRQPEVVLKAKARNLAYMVWPIGALELDARARRGRVEGRLDIAGLEAATLELEADAPFAWAINGDGSGQFDFDTRAEASAALRLRKIPIARFLRLWRDDIDLAGVAELTVEYSDPGAAPRFDVWVRGEGLRVEGRKIDALLGRGHLEADDAAFDLSVREGSRIRAIAHVEGQPRFTLWPWLLEWPPSRRYAARVELFEWSPRDLAPWSGAESWPVEQEFTAHVSLEAEGSSSEQVVLAQVAGTWTSPWQPQPQAVDLRFEHAGGRQQLDFSLGQSDAAHVAGSARVELGKNLGVVLEDGWQSAAVKGQLELRDFDLSTLSGVFPPEVDQLRGRIFGDVRVGGRLDDPKGEGFVSVRDAGMTVVPVRQRITGLGFDLRWREGNLAVEDFQLRSGNGRVRGQGRVSWPRMDATDLEAALTLQVDDLPIYLVGKPAMHLDTELSASWRRRAGRDRYALELRRSKIELLERTIAAPKKIPSSDKLTFVDARAQAGDEAEVEASAPSMDFSIAVVDPLLIQGGAMRMRWQGKLQGSVENGAVRTEGSIDSRGGYFELLGRRFAIDEGSVSLSRGMSAEPYVDVRATTRVRELDITARVSGPLRALALELSSSDGQSESEVVHRLLSGRGDGEADMDEQGRARAASVLASMSNSALTQRLRRAVHLDSMGLTFGDSLREPILHVGKQLTPRIYAETSYHHGADETKGDSRAELRVRWRFRPSWSLEAYSGTAKAGGLELFWDRRFDLRLRRRKSEKATQPAKITAPGGSDSE